MPLACFVVNNLTRARLGGSAIFKRTRMVLAQVVVLGSYVPIWMAAAVIGGAIATVVKVLFVKIGLDPQLPAKPLVYLGILALLILGTWLVMTDV